MSTLSTILRAVMFIRVWSLCQHRYPRARKVFCVQRQQQAWVISAVVSSYALVRYITATYPKPNNTDIVKPILKKLDIENLQTTLKAFSSFRTRCTLTRFALYSKLTPFTDYRSEVLHFA